jgi:hypothetical protein
MEKSHRLLYVLCMYVGTYTVHLQGHQSNIFVCYDIVIFFGGNLIALITFSFQEETICITRFINISYIAWRDGQGM